MIIISLLSKITFRGLSYFGVGRVYNSQLAKKFEIAHAKGWMDREFTKFYNPAVRARANGNRAYVGLMNEFFDHSEKDKKAWRKFVQHSRNKVCLEIGPGPVGNVLQWYWLKKPVIIDPLAEEYKTYQLKKFGKTLFRPEIKIFNFKAEQFLPELEGKVDGFIFSRNALDHLEDPLLVIENISRYSKPGCYLLLWTDLWHLRGIDAGHRNISKSISSFRNLLIGSGFKIEKELKKIRHDRSTIEYGCRAVKVLVPE